MERDEVTVHEAKREAGDAVGSAGPGAPAPAPSRRRHSIVLSVLGILAVVGIVPLGLMGWQVTSQQAEELATAQKEDQLDKATLLAQEIGRYVEEHFARLETVADGLYFQLASDAARQSGGDDDAPERDVEDLPNQLVGSLLERHVTPRRGLLELRLVGAGDRADVVRVHAQSFDRNEIAGDLEPRIEEAVARGRAGLRSLSDPFLPEARPLHPLAVFGVPLRSVTPGDAERAVLVGVVSLAPIQASIQHSGADDGAYTIFVLDDSPDARPFAHSQFTAVVEGADLSDHPLVADFLKVGLSSKVEEFTVSDAGGEARRMVGAYVPIPVNHEDNRWGVFVQVDRASGFHAVRAMRLRTLSWGIVAFVLATVIAVAFSWRITRPIHQLTESTRRIASGEWGRRVAVTANNELGMLADNFNVMSDEIRHTIDDLSEQKEVNDQLFLSSIRSLAAAIDARDPYTRGHSERVRRYARIIARQLGLPADQIRSIEIGALLHDVGKIGIEDRILRKPAALTPEEFEIMKTHPEKGGDIMEPISFLREATEIIVHHHERYDGNGYPAGMKGEEIPLGARIVNVADTFDAMTTNRPYQRAMTFSAAAEKIGEFAGRACDPVVVEAFHAAIEAGHFGRFGAEPPERQAG